MPTKYFMNYALLIEGSSFLLMSVLCFILDQYYSRKKNTREMSWQKRETSVKHSDIWRWCGCVQGIRNRCEESTGLLNAGVRRGLYGLIVFCFPFSVS